MLAGEPRGLSTTGVDALIDHIGERPVRVTVAGVPERLPLVTTWAPLAGGDTPDELFADALNEASVAAMTSASRLSTCCSVQHRAVRSWSEALRMAVDHDLLILGGRVHRRRDRKALATLRRTLPVVEVD